MSDSKQTFLVAHWGNLILLNYSVPAEVLIPHLPKGCELDLYEGKSWVSLVAFQFTQTKVFGLKWPGFTNFPEVNLRFYVRHNGVRGVCFIREFVPSRLVSWIANSLYNEHYKKAEMHETLLKMYGLIHMKYWMQCGGGVFSCEVNAEDKPHLPAENSIEHFFKEHELGVGKDRRGNTLTYNVHHPHWQVYPVKGYKIRLDAEKLYGKDFAFLSEREPNSVVFALGSEITVFKKS